MDMLAPSPEADAAPASSPMRAGPATLAPAARVPIGAVPSAVVVVPVRPGDLCTLRPVLASIAASRAAGDVPVAPGALAVLVLAADPGALVVVEALAPAYPFPLRVEPGLGDAVFAARRASAWALTLGRGGGRAEVPVLLLPGDGRPVPPRWAHGLLAALRDGADLVTRRAGVAGWLLGNTRTPAALSSRALRAMERWTEAGGPATRGGAWTERGSPWRRPARAGLRAVAA